MLRPRWRRHARGRAVSVRSSRSAAERRPRAERLDGVHCVLEALRAQRRDLRRLLVSPVRGGRPGTELAQVLDAAEAAGVPVEWVEPDALRAPEGRGNPQHVVLETGPLPELALDALLEGTPGQRRLVVLDGVEDPQNLGALARVAEASGAIGLVLGERRAAPLSPAASRASAGALEWLPVARVANLTRAIEIAKTRGFWVIAADQRANDLGHWQTRLGAADAVETAAMLRQRGVAFVSPGVVDVPDDALGFDLSLLVRDPDGHAVEVVQP